MAQTIVIGRITADLEMKTSAKIPMSGLTLWKISGTRKTADRSTSRFAHGAMTQKESSKPVSKKEASFGCPARWSLRHLQNETALPRIRG